MQVFTPYLPSLNIEDKEEQAAFRKALVQPDGAMTVKFMVAERMIADVKTEYYCGDQTTLADYHLFAWLGFVRTECGSIHLLNFMKCDDHNIVPIVAVSSKPLNVGGLIIMKYQDITNVAKIYHVLMQSMCAVLWRVCLSNTWRVSRR